MAFTSKIFINAPPKPAPINEQTKGTIEYFKLTAKIAGSVIPTSVGIKLEIAISLSLDFS